MESCGQVKRAARPARRSRHPHSLEGMVRDDKEAITILGNMS